MVGLGNFGTAVGNLIAENGYDVLGWDHNGDVVDQINQTHFNPSYLPGIELNRSLVATHDLLQVFDQCAVVFIAVPSVYIHSTLEPIHSEAAEDVLLVNLAKGIELETGLTAFQRVGCLFPRNPRVVLSGPSIANEFSRKMPTTVVIASKDHNNLLTVSKLLDNDYFRTRFSKDVIGVELGGILKNIYAIGLGLFDGKEITSVNFRSVFLTIALEEIAKIGVGMGAEVRTFLYVSGMGDLLATSMSEHSHNRRLGVYLAQGLSLSEIKERMGVFPEGYSTIQATLYIAEKLHVSMPLAKGLWDVINSRYDADKFISAFIKDFVE
jgi:glycerol-3-phosphate dehydrogenase (NAD(P)+)